MGKKQETPSQREARLKKNRERAREKRAKETSEEKEVRLAKRRKKDKEARELNADHHADVLAKKREREANRRADATPEEIVHRKEIAHENYLIRVANETQEQRAERLARKSQKSQDSRSSETQSQREIRMEKDREWHANSLANETPSQREIRLQAKRDRIANETEEQRSQRLSNCSFNSQLIRMMQDEEEKEARLQAERQKYKELQSKVETFKRAINVYADQQCEICTKQCYPNQIVKYIMPASPPTYLPNELKNKPFLMVCHTCKSHLMKKNKKLHPPKAYWNKLDPGAVPNCIKVLTKAEIGLLSRIHPYIKVIKFDGRFGQYGFKGHATLFAKDIFEVTEKVDVLPRTTHDSNIVIVTEEYENLNITREYKVDRTRLFTALRWLIQNNPLYKDVKIDDEVVLDENHLVRIAQEEDQTAQQPQNSQQAQNAEPSPENDQPAQQ
jgi:hypothetical protein